MGIYWVPIPFQRAPCLGASTATARGPPSQGAFPPPFPHMNWELHNIPANYADQVIQAVIFLSISWRSPFQPLISGHVNSASPKGSWSQNCQGYVLLSWGFPFQKKIREKKHISKNSCFYKACKCNLANQTTLGGDFMFFLCGYNYVSFLLLLETIQVWYGSNGLIPFYHCFLLE